MTVQNTETHTKHRIPNTIWFILISVFIGKMCTGMSSILFPVTLGATGISNSMIGIILSAEIISIILLSPVIGIMIGKLGVIGSIITGSIGRMIVLIIFAYTDNIVIWLLFLLIYGLSSTLLGIACQTWINCSDLKNYRGLVMGIYISGMSGGIALGPVILQFINAAENRELAYALAAVVSLISLVPIIFIWSAKPPFKAGVKPRILFVLKNGKKVIFGGFIGGIILLGLPAFLTLYGMNAGMTLNQASLLLSMFSLGALISGPLLAYFSDKFKDRHNMVILSFFMSLLCSFFLPIAITNKTVAYILLFLWGSAMQGVYSGCMTLLADIFRKEDQISASVTFTQFKAMGGFLGITLIGLAMDWANSEGLVYIVAIASIIYFTFALSQYRVE